MAGDIFISYSSKESKIAEKIKELLEEKNMSYWMAPYSIPAGSNYATEIQKGIRESKIFLLLFSKNSQNSRNVSTELDRAFNNKKILIALQLDDEEIDDNFDYYLCQSQRIDAYHDFQKGLDELIVTLQTKYDNKFAEKIENEKSNTDKKEEEHKLKDGCGFLKITAINDMNKPLAKTEFDIYDKDGYLQYSIMSNKKGQASIDLEYGKYFFKNVSVEDKYKVEDTLYTITIDENCRTFYKTYTFGQCFGTLLLVVTNKRNHAITNISFTVYDENKEKINELHTNKKGLAGLKNIPAGKYFYKNDIDDTYVDFEIKENGEIVRRDIVI